MMDVSGSMADEQKEIVRIEAFWIDTWLRTPLQGRRDPLHHPRRGRPGGRRDTFYHTRESGGTKITSAYKLVQQDHRRASTRRTSGTSTPSTSPTATTGGDDTDRCVESAARAKLLPKVNLFGYGQVESPYGSGEFFDDLENDFGDDENLVTLARSTNKDDIYESIKDFLGKGQVAHVDDCSNRSDIASPASWHDIQRGDRELRARVRPRLLRDDLRGARLRRDEQGRRLRRVPDPLPALAVRHGVRAAHQGLRVRALRRSTRWSSTTTRATPTCSSATTLVDQKLVMAHVYGHSDFFKNNIWFSQTNRKMMDEMANHATQVRKYIDSTARRGRELHRPLPVASTT